MAVWREESQNPPSIKRETRPAEQPVLQISHSQLLENHPQTLSLQVHLDQLTEQRERLVIERISEPSVLGATLGTVLSLGLLVAGLWLDRQSLPRSASDELGPWGWGSLALLSTDLLVSVLISDPQISETILNESPWKAVSESPGKVLGLRKARLYAAENNWESETLIDAQGQAQFDLSTLPASLRARSALKLTLEVQDPIYGRLVREWPLNEGLMQALRKAQTPLLSQTAALAQAPLSLEPIPETPKKHAGLAIIIGNQDYRMAPASEFALRDAEMVQRYAQHSLGFLPQNTIHLANASKAQLETVFGSKDEPRSQMADWHTPQTPLLIYYSGHGAATLSGKSYLLPVDANPNYLASSGYALETLYQNLARIPYSELTVIVDACFSGMTPGGPLLPDRKPLVLETVQHTLPKLPRALLLHASQSREMSVWWKAQKHSLFTFYLLKGLQGAANDNHDQHLSAQELQRYLQTEVPQQARRLLGADQNPVFWGDLQRTLLVYPPVDR